MNRIRVFTSGAFFLFAAYCLCYNHDLPFSFSDDVYTALTIYFAIFPIKDMFACSNSTLYKGRQFARHYIENKNLNEQAFSIMKRKVNRRAIYAGSFWLVFLIVPGMLFKLNYVHPIWIFFFFALSNFSVFFAIFGWCPFNSIFIKPDCCMECRIYNWDSFFQYSFLIWIPDSRAIFLCILGLSSLIKWEYMHAKYPKHFYKCSNLKLTCENCDLDSCRKHKKKRFHKVLKKKVTEQINNL